MNYDYDPDAIQYTVQDGDTLWDLAGDYNTTVEAIITSNPNIDFNNWYVGQVISIPGDLQSVNAEQFRRDRRGFRPGFRPGFGRRFGRRFRPFRPIFRPPVIIAPFPPFYPYQPYCSPYDPYCPYY